jgi:hypothetical protein
MFCAPGLILGGIEGVGSHFHVLRFVIVLGGTEGARSSFHILRFRTRFGRYRGCPVPFSCFALTDLFSAIPREPSPI